MTSLGIAIPICWIIMCASAHHHQLIPMNPLFWLRRHSGHELVLGKSNLNWLTVKLVFNLFLFDRCIWVWYTDTELIIPLPLSIKIFRCFYLRCLRILSSYGWVPTLIPDSRYATWPFGGLLPTVSLCPKSLMNFPWYKMPPANGIIYFLSLAFCFRTCILYSCCWM